MARVAATYMRAMELNCDNNRHEANRIFHVLPAMIAQSQRVVGCIFPTRHRYRYCFLSDLVHFLLRLW